MGSVLLLAALGVGVSVVLPSATNAAEKPTQNELAINRAFDGTRLFNNGSELPLDPLNNDATGAHTPGLDANENNYVVRTHDGFGVRVDWDVNEANATGVTLTVTLANGASNPATDGRITMRREGYIAGCDAARSSLSADQLTYTCYLGDVAEGTHGTILPVFTLDHGTDGTPMTINATLKSDQTAPVSSGPITFFVSEAPSADWLKQTAVVRPITTPAPGYVVMFPLALRDNSQVDSVNPLRGTGQLRYSAFDFYDHGYKLPVDTRMATAAEMTAAGIAGAPCGNYDAGNGALIDGGQFPVNPTVTITCSPVTPAPYLLTKLAVSLPQGIEGTPAIAPKTLANGAPNYGGLVYAGQIAYFVPEASASPNVEFSNALSASVPVIDPANPVITKVPVDNKGNTESNTTNNTSNFGFGSGGGGGGGITGGTFMSHYGLFSRPVPWSPYNSGMPAGQYAFGPLWVPFFPAKNAQFPYQAQTFKPWQSVIDPVSFWDGNGVVTRNTPLTMNLTVVTSNQSSPPPERPIHGCMTWSLDQVNLLPMSPLKLDITNSEIPAPNGSVGTPTAGGNFVGPFPPAPATQKFDMLMAGQAPPYGASRDYNSGSLGPTLGDASYVGVNVPSTLNYPTLVPFDANVLKNLQIIVEYAQDAELGSNAGNSPIPFDAPINGVECNNKNPRTGTPRKWVNLDTLSAAELKTYEDPAQPGTYRFNMVRVRTVGKFPWTSPWITNTGMGASGIVLSVSGITGNDLKDVNKDGTEIIMHTARSVGAWDPATQDAPVTNDCYSWDIVNPPMFDKAIEDAIGSSASKTTNWCNMRYMTNLDKNVDTFLMTLDPNSFSWARVSPVTSSADIRFTGDSDSDRLTIVGVRPDVQKTNLAGLYAIAANGETVKYRFDVSAVGTDIEALTNFVMTDTLDPRLRFVSIDVPFSTPGATCTTPPVGETGAISCQLSQKDPKNPSGPLPVGLPGGWKDSMTITVRVENATSSTGSTAGNRGIPNAVFVNTDGTGSWNTATNTFVDPNLILTAAQSAKAIAFSYLPTAFNQGDIVKHVAVGDGPCPIKPPTAPADEVWSTRCSLTSRDISPANGTTPDESGNLAFTLDYANTGAVPLTNLRVIDVLPFSADSVEPPSGSATPPAPGKVGANPSTVGDGRTPASQFAGTVGFKSVSLTYSGAPPALATDPNADGAVTYLYSADVPSTISRDPNASALTNTWCTAPSGGTASIGTGACPSDAFKVTAVMAVIKTVAPGETATLSMTLDTEANSCSSLYTNTFGARTNEIWMPIRSNDVSFMVNCKFDQAIQKRVAANWKPGPDFGNLGTTTVDFEIEVINQGDAIKDFDVTDYVDTKVFKFLAADNPAGKTTAGTLGASKTGPTLDYTWVGADGADKPVAKVLGQLPAGASVILPIRLRLISLDGRLVNHTEISRFDDDGNPANGDSDVTNPKNPTAGPLIDVDSTPDQIFGNDVEIDNEINKTPATGDEDDEDVAEVPYLYSLGNQVWIDTNNNGLVDTGEAPVPGVAMLLFKDANGDGVIDDTNGDGKSDEADAVANTKTDDKGLYLFSSLTAGGYMVGVAKANFDAKGVLEFYRSSDPTAASPNNNIDQDDNGIVNTTLADVLSGTITIGGVEPLNEVGPHNDPNVDALSNLTIDFGFYQPRFDLALRKVLAGNETVTVGELANFAITVFNQGNVTASAIELVDYPDSSLVLADSRWTVGDKGYPYLKLPGTLEPGKSVTVEITFRTTKLQAAVNNSEIFKATPVGADGKTLTYVNGKTVVDADSVPDNTFGNDVEIDNEINLTPATGDEDDEDIARINVVAPVSPDTVAPTLPPPTTTLKLPVGGSNSKGGLLMGVVLVSMGLVAFGSTRRRHKVQSASSV